MRRTTFCVIAVPTVGWLAGCSTFDVDNGQSVILGAEDRVVLTKKNDDGLRLVGPEIDQSFEVGTHARRLVCAEPSPDAISSLAWSSAASANIFGQGQGSLAAGLAENAASIGLRTGSIQILRDLSFRACEGVMNGVIGAPGYARLMSGVDIAALGLEALGTLSPKPAAPGAAVSSVAPGLSAESKLTKATGPGGAPTADTKGQVEKGDAVTSQVGTSAGNFPNLSTDAVKGVVQVVCLTTIAAPLLSASLDGRAKPEQVPPLVSICLGSGK